MENDLLDQWALEELLSEELPDNRLPTTEECLDAYAHPESADPKIIAYIRRRPPFRQFIESCLSEEGPV